MSTCILTMYTYSPPPYGLVEIYIDLSIFRAYESRSYLCYRMNTIAEHKQEFS